MCDLLYLFLICDVSAHGQCVISPNLTALTIANGLTRDVEFHCQCMDSNRMMINGTRWLLSNGNSAPTNVSFPPSILYIAGPFYNSGTYICSPNNMTNNPSRDMITLTTGSESAPCTAKFVIIKL